MKNTLKLTIPIILISTTLNGANVAFNTFGSGNILDSSQQTINSGSIFRFGTFDVDFAVLETYTTIAQFEEQFNQVGGNFTFNGDGNVGAFNPTFGDSDKVFYWAFNQNTTTVSETTELAIFGGTMVNGIAGLNQTPEQITEAMILWGSKAGDDILLASATGAVPEPSTYAALIGAAALGFVAYRRRSKKA